MCCRSAKMWVISAACSAPPKDCRRKHGLTRCFDTPIGEGGIVGRRDRHGRLWFAPCRGNAVRRLHLSRFDQIVSEAARLRYRSAGDFTAPITIRTPYGGGIFGGQTHSQIAEALFTHVAGIKTVIPSTPYDAKGLLISAIEDDDPVIFLEPKRIYNGPFNGHHESPCSRGRSIRQATCRKGYYTVPLGKAAVVREGGDLTVLAYGTMVHVALAARTTAASTPK